MLIYQTIVKKNLFCYDGTVRRRDILGLTIVVQLLYLCRPNSFSLYVTRDACTITKFAGITLPFRQCWELCCHDIMPLKKQNVNVSAFGTYYLANSCLLTTDKKWERMAFLSISCFQQMTICVKGLCGPHCWSNFFTKQLNVN